MLIDLEEIRNWSTIGSWAEAKMVQGYMGGLDLNQPEPNANRSRSYRHGFVNGRDDRSGSPRSC